MNLFSYFIIALVFAENDARKGFAKVNFADQADKSVRIDISESAKLVQASEGSIKKEAGYRGEVNLGINEDEVKSDEQDANILKDTAILAKLINVVNKNAKTKAKKTNSDEVVTNEDTIQRETAKLAKLINLVNKGAVRNNFKKLSLSDQDKIINIKKSKLDKLIHLINKDKNKGKKKNIDEAGRYEDNDSSEENAQHMQAALAYLANIHQDDEDKDVSEMEEEDKELNESPVERFGNDYYVVGNDDRTENLKLIMSLIQSSFDRNTEKAGKRLHVINNPEVLKKYKEQLRRGSHQPLPKDEDLPMNFNDFMKDLRRNAVFRLDESSDERFLRSEHKNDVAEIIKKTVDKQYDSVKKSFDRAQLKNDDGDRNDIKKRSRNKDSKEINAWDIITKQYDSDNKPRNKYKNDVSEYKHNLKDEFTKNVRKDDWDKTDIRNDDKITKHKTSDNWDKLKNNDEINKKRKNKYWDDDTNNNDRNDKRNNNDRGKKVKNNEDWNQDRQNKNDWGKKGKTNDDWDQRIKNDNNRVQNKKPRNDNWEPKKNKYDDIDIKTPKAKKNIDDWSNTDNKSFKDKKQRDRGEKKKPVKIKDLEASFEIPKKERNIDYESVKITTRKWKSNSYDEWDRPRPKKAFGREGGGFFGRTPIPFVGKRGIYADK